MSGKSDHEVTRLLHQWAGGDERSAEPLMELVYAELHRIAAWHLRKERKDHTLQPTALVHEAYLRLAIPREWQDRTHFFAVAARVVRRVLVDHARARHTVKRGEGCLTVTLADSDGCVQPSSTDILDVDAALETLERLDSTLARVVELRYFSGLSVAETAAVLGLSQSSVKRDWTFARAWLRKQMEGPHT